MTGILFLTDGTTRINLLTGIDGFYLNNWNPSIAGTKDTWRESPLSDSRKLAMSKWANAIETFSFIVSRFTQDDVIYETQELRRLLEAAKQYFIGGSDVPVWLEARGECETNTRYAVVCAYSTGNDSDPYHLPFDLDHPVMAPWTLVVERQHWRAEVPGTSTCVQLSATQDYYDASEANYVPTESADDCYVNHSGAGAINLNGVVLSLGNVAPGDSTGSGVRFRSVAIPQGGVILQAYIEFEADADDVGDNCNILISGNDVDNAAIFSTYADFTGRVLTAANAAWNAISHWVAGTHYQTPSIVTVVQEIVSRPGWASGNSMAFILDDVASTAGAHRLPVAWDHAAVRYEPHLIVWWYDTTTRTFGRTATCNNEVYIANKHNIAQLTHIYNYNVGLGVFSANLVGAALPFGLLPLIPAANDAVYFGIATGVTNSGPFCSLVFDISNAQVDLNIITWQYYDSVAVAWHDLDVRDNTNANGAMTGLAFDTTGVNSVHWIQPAGAVHNWGTTIVNGVTGYWVRVLVGGVGGAPSTPVQQNRDIYTIVTPYVDTLSAQVPGDIQALSELLLEGQSGQDTPQPTIHAQEVVYAGLRSYDRGSNFSSFLNIADEQNLTGIAVSVNGGTCTFVTDVFTPTGRCANWTTGGAAAEAWLSYITIPSSLVRDFTGKFRCFLRMQTITATPTDLRLRLKLCSAIYTNIVYQTLQASPTTGAGTRFEILDFGTITIPFRQYDDGDIHYGFILRIDGQALAAVQAHLIDLWIVPSDECFMEIRAVPILGSTTVSPVATLVYGSGSPKKLDVDSTIPRRMIKTDIVNSSGTIFSAWENKIIGPLIWQPNERQRWWITQLDNEIARTGSHSDSLSLQGWKVSRYLSMRGAR